ncbi:uncharacterized protein HMPREF1541_09301 [Cyphellophora europaea CBS 101466]|uniref:TeaA receptor TeaR n=1 Tax=Cyphellophora europaea (strain CBS 101466) TaxID=1220924 RepID=W2SC28_CYPE1|nr:uncharacterized protein HMPREF1541_09301 [Cyphellophora europaea CBS 101466]ETN45469.1 hypothetical protein HMPREF1541_09301 [Cyphellophora europaea CBS 101466]
MPKNTVSNKASRPSSKRNNSAGSSRTPLSSVTPNQRGTNDQGMNGRPPHSRGEELGQQNNSVSKIGSESDSPIDLYQNSNKLKPKHANYDNEIPENMYKPRDEDPEGWIHRDKLAKIESEELQAAGIHLASARRGQSKNGRRDTSRGRRSEESSHSATNERRDEKKPRLAEPVQEEGDDERVNWDFRSAEEIAQDAAAGNLYSQPALRKSGSRIPVMTSSPHPIPPERLDRETPLPRKRTMSNSMSPDDSLGVSRTRMRRGSTGSQDGLEGAITPTPKPGSHPGSKPASPTKKDKATPGALASNSRKTTPSSIRKPSGPVKNGPLSPSGSTSQRPGTRSGELDRPKTAVNRPEGDPPWLATMYKPDPRLPPDQQIIPTHARRQQQQMWADDGSVPKTYDRDFTPLAVHQPEELAKGTSPTLASPVPESEKPQENSWPLRQMNSVRSTASGRPGTSGSTTGGYSTMPKVQPSPVIQQSPRIGGMASPHLGVAPSRLQVQRPPDDEKDDGTVKKGCGCCIVM